MITLTEAGIREVKRLMAAQNLTGAFLRMGVRGGGCSGLSYFLEFDTELGPHDRKLEADGVTLDYAMGGLTGGFAFRNPNARHTCGCGSSFAPQSPGS